MCNPLDGGSILAPRNWVSNGSLQPPNHTFFPQDRVEAQIAALEPRDRDAIVTWMNSGGRGKLYARGATDGDIGPCLFYAGQLLEHHLIAGMLPIFRALYVRVQVSAVRYDHGTTWTLKT